MESEQKKKEEDLKEITRVTLYSKGVYVRSYFNCSNVSINREAGFLTFLTDGETKRIESNLEYVIEREKVQETSSTPNPKG